MRFPQIAMITWYLLILLLASNQHGKQISYKTNFWVISVLVVANIATLIAGGFFSVN